MKPLLFAASLCCCGSSIALAAEPAPSPVAPSAASTRIERLLEPLREERRASLAGVPLLAARLLADFYAGRNGRPVWTDPARSAALLRLIDASPDEGLAPADFHADLLRAAAAQRDEDARALLDILRTDALLRYLHHTRFGKLDPRTVDSKWHDRPAIPAGRLLDELNAAVAAPDLADFAARRLEPPDWYARLRQALRNQRALERLSALPPLPAGSNLGLGSRGPRVALLRERLAQIETALQIAASAAAASPEVFDAGLRAQVIAVQRGLGLTPDGMVGPATLARLNGPADPERIARIRINLERMRWLYDDLPPDYLFVDVAAYRVHLVRGGEIAWSTRVIVGAPQTQTPMFRDALEHLIFNPTWTVPASIQKRLGRVGDTYLLVDRQTGQRLRGGDTSNVARYQVIQQPGPKNALGAVKFMFPNGHAVYLHDTPGKALFNRPARSLSNGCVRVERPLELAERILDRPPWDQAGIAELVARGRTRYLYLEEPLPVLLYYLTAFVNSEGQLSFRTDFYERDGRLRELLDQPVTQARISFPEPEAAPGATPDGAVAKPPERVQPASVGNADPDGKVS